MVANYSPVSSSVACDNWLHTSQMTSLFWAFPTALPTPTYKVKIPTIQVRECHRVGLGNSQSHCWDRTAKVWEVSHLHSLGFWRVSQIPPFLHAQKHFWDRPTFTWLVRCQIQSLPRSNCVPKPIERKTGGNLMTFFQLLKFTALSGIFTLLIGKSSLRRWILNSNLKEEGIFQEWNGFRLLSFRKNWAHPLLCFRCLCKHFHYNSPCSLDSFVQVFVSLTPNKVPGVE